MDEDIPKGFRCGMVSIVGRPNSGKSTLLNRILEEKVAIVSKIPQTTRQQIRGVYNDDRCQIIFLDTPGLHKGKDKLNDAMNQSSVQSIEDTDCIIYLVDTSRRIGVEEQSIADKLKSLRKPVILGLNKVDRGAKHLAEYVSFWEEAKGQPVTEMKNFRMVALSGKEGVNVSALIDVVNELIPESPPLYERDVVCDIPQKLAVSELIREKVFWFTDDEIPHSVTVVVEEMQPRKNNNYLVKAIILVERETQKEIIIGKGGQMLKKIGVEARKDLEDLLQAKVFLELFVKTQKNWRESDTLLREFGYLL